MAIPGRGSWWLALPVGLWAIAILLPLVLMAVVSFWERRLIGFEPALSLDAYELFFRGVRLEVLLRSLAVASLATALMVLVAYPVAYAAAFVLGKRTARVLLWLLAVPFLINYVIRTFAWADVLGRQGFINATLLQWGLIDAPLDWLLFSDFAVYLGLVAAYMPFMVFPIYLSLSAIDGALLDASGCLGDTPLQTFCRVVLPLSLPGLSAAAIFGFVGALGEVAVPLILGGVGYQLLGNTITSALAVLNYPLAAAMSTVVVAIMTAALWAWLGLFDLRALLGHTLGRR
ncbi:MAG: ABC transporter permease [Candidatus Competibacterales bacterium]